MPNEGTTPPPRRRRRDFGSIFLRGKVWTVRWHEHGRTRTKAIGLTKGLAERFLAKKRADLDMAEALGIRPIDSIRFEDLLDRYASLFGGGQKSRFTLIHEERYLRSVVLRRFKGMHIEDIRQEDVERFLTEHVERNHLSGSTRNRLLSILSALFKRAVRSNHARENPCKGIPRSKESLKDVPFLSIEDQEKLANTFVGDMRNAVLLTLDTGLRLGELLRLEWQDIEFRDRALTVRVSKNRTPRTIPFTFRGQAALEAQRVLHGDSPPKASDLVFARLAYTKTTGEPDFPGSIRVVWKAGREAAGLPTLRWHDLRHAFAVTAVRAGVPLGDLQKLLGHKSLVMVLRYSRHSPANFQQEARDRIERFLREGRAEPQQLTTTAVSGADGRSPGPGVHRQEPPPSTPPSGSPGTSP